MRSSLHLSPHGSVSSWFCLFMALSPHGSVSSRLCLLMALSPHGSVSSRFCLFMALSLHGSVSSWFCLFMAMASITHITRHNRHYIHDLAKKCTVEDGDGSVNSWTKGLETEMWTVGSKYCRENKDSENKKTYSDVLDGLASSVVPEPIVKPQSDQLQRWL